MTLSKGKGDEGSTYKGSEKRGGGLLLRGTKGRERRREGTEKEGRGVPAKKR